MQRGVHRAGAHRDGCTGRGAQQRGRSDQAHRGGHGRGAVGEDAVGNVALLAVRRRALQRRRRIAEPPRGHRRRTAAVERHAVNRAQPAHQCGELGARQAHARRRLPPVNFQKQQRSVRLDRRAGGGNALRVFAAGRAVGIVEPAPVAQDEGSAADGAVYREQRNGRKVAAGCDDVAGIGQAVRSVRL